jgi:hypothetical protein
MRTEAEKFIMSKLVDEKSWKEFNSTGLFKDINKVLHDKGWILICELDEDNVRVYPGKIC